MRKLLPYEHQLIEALGVSKEDYFDFLDARDAYEDPKVGTELDIRNSDPATVAIVLTVVGILFQVGAALLAPKPEIPDISDRRRRNRQQRFAPTYGFNSAQDLATYGDPVNLIYTNENPYGDVRVNGSLVWSAIENVGSTQFMELMLVIGASNISKINYNRLAFGQKALESFGKSHFFIFGKSNGADGVPQFKDLRAGHRVRDFYPRRLVPGDETKPACLVHIKGEKARNGYSQAYTPTTSTSLGVFDAIPINIDVLNRNKKGKQESADIGIEIIKGNRWGNDKPTFEENDVFIMRFQSASYRDGDKLGAQTAADLRRQMVEALDFSSIYILGSARFRLTNLSNTNLEKGDCEATFKCIERGHVPASLYSRRRPKDEEDLEELKTSIEHAIEIINNQQVDVDADGNPLEGEPAKRDVSIAGNITTGFEVRDRIVNLDVKQKGTVKFGPWTTKYKVIDKKGKKNDVFYNFKNGPFVYDLGGSLAYSQEQYNSVDAELRIDPEDVRRQITQHIKGLKNLRDKVAEGVYDGDPLPQGWNMYQGYHKGKVFYGTPPDAINVPINQRSQRIANTFIHDYTGGPKNFKFRGMRGSENGNIVDMGTSCPNIPGRHTHLTFIYQDRSGTWNFFNFNGVNNDTNEDNRVELFRHDDTLRHRRNRLEEANLSYQETFKKVSELRKSIEQVKAEAIEGGGAKNVLESDTTLEKLAKFNEQLSDKRRKIQKRTEGIARRIAKNFATMHQFAIDIIEDDIEYLEDLRDQLPTKDAPDRFGANFVKEQITAKVRQKREDLGKLEFALDNWEDVVASIDNNFFSKCLVKAEEAAYDTVSRCQSIKFSFKARLFRRISGRQKKYGDEKVEQYSNSDNGVKSRMAFFRVYYKPRDGKTGFTVVPIIFAVRRGSDADFYTQLEFWSPTNEHYSFKFETLHDIRAEHSNRGFKHYAFMDNSDKAKTFTMPNKDVFTWYGRVVEKNKIFSYYPDERERGPYGTNEWDMFSVNSDTQVQFSFESGPEISLTAVNEQQLQNSIADETTYQNMTMVALGLYSGRGLQDLRSVSVLVKEGKTCRTVESPKKIPSNSKSTSYAPDIFVDTLLDPVHGLGQYLTHQNIDLDSLKLAKAFCKNNNLPVQEGDRIKLYMDGIIADPGSWREFWITNGPFSLLELARKNGRDTLVPALPVNSSGRAAEDSGRPIEVSVSALFTAGNILEGSYKEEFLNYGAATEDIIASIIYRDFEGGEIFTTNRTVEVRLKDTNESTAVRETFDLSQFVTQKEQAIMFGKLLCNQRHYIRRGIEFQTFPTEALIEPGDFIYVDVGLQNWDSYSSGVIQKDGVLNAPLLDSLSARSYEFLLYNISTGQTLKTSADVTKSGDVNRAASLAKYQDYMFVMGRDKPRKRVFRVTEIAVEEEGEISVKAIEYPCFEESGKLRARIADFRSSKFTVS